MSLLVTGPYSAKALAPFTWYPYSWGTWVTQSLEPLSPCTPKEWPSVHRPPLLDPVPIPFSQCPAHVPCAKLPSPPSADFTAPPMSCQWPLRLPYMPSNTSFFARVTFP